MSAVEYRQHRFSAPPGSTEVLLIRHGESAPARPDRPFSLVDGQGDPELAPTGVAHARAVADRLAGEGLDALYVTTLRRTAETAAPLAARLGVEPRVEAGLREVHLGSWEGGLLRRKTAEGDPVAVRLRAEQRWDVIPGAETNEAFDARVAAALDRLHEDHPDQRIAVFTHGGVIAAALARATGSRPFAFLGSDNGSLSQLVLAGPQWILRRFNDTTHLGGGLSQAPQGLT
ncbi:histidine phosphatase family protein [Saccharopolyspora cebuensis]|uniref:Histidine phosphatase family protein n=1 Tax=Saccharopolyspora cebuensis TaxID=418759 RepID=A0ABV4CGW1_9PSEU